MCRSRPLHCPISPGSGPQLWNRHSSFPSKSRNLPHLLRSRPQHPWGPSHGSSSRHWAPRTAKLRVQSPGVPPGGSFPYPRPPLPHPPGGRPAAASRSPPRGLRHKSSGARRHRAPPLRDRCRLPGLPSPGGEKRGGEIHDESGPDLCVWAARGRAEWGARGDLLCAGRPGGLHTGVWCAGSGLSLWRGVRMWGCRTKCDARETVFRAGRGGKGPHVARRVGIFRASSGVVW
mmetsp:Transcript_29363/g.40542  ORF Transcript_29363/g.40542 Transcript_29363/m.40542 type:complete len:232 (+) Transcript_29363:543-1238(+)